MIKLISPKALRTLGILGMNRRNIGLIGNYNQRINYHIADNKLATKSAALDRGIPVPELYGTVEHQFQVPSLDKQIQSLSSFVIKPAQGSGGKGILVIVGREGDRFVKSSGVTISGDEVKRHVSNILAGLYSLAGRNDVAMLEALIDVEPILKDFSVDGVPDIRIIVFRGVPVMAMMRCATHASDGKANLHQGAVGVGIDIGLGQAVAAVQHSAVISSHPDTGIGFYQLEVPFWSRILRLAAGCANMAGLGYLGADIVLDRLRGPMLLELNARPGLTIQVANQAGLRHRLAIADEIANSTEDQSEKIRLARTAFASSHPSLGQMSLDII